MASSNINSYLKTIKEADRGEAVRDAIINAVKNMTVVGNNAGTLGGKQPEEYASSDTLSFYINQIENIYMKFDTEEDYVADIEVTKKSTNMMSSGSIYALLNGYLRASLFKMTNFESDPLRWDVDFEKAFKYYIGQIETAKADIGDALKAKGKDVEDKSVKNLKDYARLIREIGDKEVELIQEVKFTEPGKHDAGKSDDGKKMKAWKKVEVELKENKYRATKNGKFTAPEGKPWTEIEVSISTSGNSGRSGKGRLSGKSGTDLTDDNLLTTATFTENDVYPPADGTYGYKVVNVDVSVPNVDENQTFEVTFLDSGTSENEETVELGRVQVQAYGNAALENPPDKKIGDEGETLYFRGWEPMPIHVVSNMDVRATWSPIPPSSGDEITKSWSEIVAEQGMGSDYNIGDHKVIHLSSGSALDMQLVARGVDAGSASTWISKNIISETVGQSFGLNWAGCDFRSYLNGSFIDLIRNSSDDGAQELADALVPVKKYTFGLYQSATKVRNVTYGEFETNDRVWVPSARELFGPVAFGETINKWIEYVFNGKNPTTGEYDSSRFPRSQDTISNPGFMYNILHWYESRGPVYSELYGDSEYLMACDENISSSGTKPYKTMIIPSPPNKDAFKKRNAANTSYVGYSLRTPCNIWLKDDGVNWQVSMMYWIDSNGKCPKADYLSNTSAIAGSPIGFCL